MIDFIKKYRIQVIIGALMLILGVPFIIHILFKIYPKNNFLQAEWSAGELLSYYGSVLTFLGTASLGILALWQNQIIEQKSSEHNKLIQEIEVKRNMPKLRCVFRGSNGNFMNLSTQIDNISENIASSITVTNFEIRDNQDEIIKTSTNFKLEKDTLCGGESLNLSFFNEPIHGTNLNISFQFACIDKYSKTHRYKVFGSIADSTNIKLQLNTIEVEV